MIRSYWLVTLVLLTALAASVYAQEGQRRRPDFPPREQREFPKPDTAHIRQMFDKVMEAIGEKADSPAAKVFQNVQVWKEMPAGRMLGMMRAWTRTIGVGCDHCHVEDHWEKDDKAPKLTARAMDNLVDHVNEMVKGIKSITDEHARVGCWTCHRGQPEPEFFPPRPEGQRPPRGGN